MAILVSSPKDLERFLERAGAEELFEYLEMGGILRLKVEEGKIKIIYPSKLAIEERIKELEEKRRDVIFELAKLRRINKRKRVIDPLKIKHRILYLIDSEYKEISDIIGADSLMDDERGRKIVEQLQKDREYRSRIREALTQSPVYRRSRFGEFVERSNEVKGKLIGDRIQRLEKILSDLNKEIDTLKKLKRWVE